MKTRSFEAQLNYYKSQHRTKGCKLTHMFGVPLIFLSIPTALFNWQSGLRMFAGGWALQFIGHYVFEKNNPVLFSEAGNPLVVVAAAVYVYDGWARLLSGRPLTDEEEDTGNGKVAQIADRSGLQQPIPTNGDGYSERRQRRHQRKPT